MDINDVEAIDVNALGGADNVVVNDISGTDLAQVGTNLAAADGGATTSRRTTSSSTPPATTTLSC